MEAKLTPKQEKFCHAYLEGGNASAAYRTAYSASRMKTETVNRKAKALLDNGKIRARIQQLQDEIKKISDIEKRRVLYELKAILDSKITDYVEFTDGSLKFKNFDELTESQIRAIDSIKQTKYGIELKLHGKSWSIERICKMLGYEAPRKVDVDHTSKGEAINEPKKVIILPSNNRDESKESGLENVQKGQKDQKK